MVFRKAWRAETSSTEALGFESFCAWSVEASVRAAVSARIFVDIRTRESYPWNGISVEL